jgi:hypothetical protein
VSTIAIELDGTDITENIIITSAQFSSQVNGVPAVFSFDIRDSGHVYQPIAGKVVTLDIDGIRLFYGFALKVTRRYAFPVDDTSNANAVEELFRIEGVDINVLLQKRVSYNPGTPAKGFLTPPGGFACPGKSEEWDEGTRVDDTVEYLIEHYTDLSADGVTVDVDDFGSPNPDGCTSWNAAMTAGQLLGDVNRELQGVFYINPYKVLKFHSADTTTTAKFLTDDPDGDPDAVGCRNFSFVSDGTKMVNDAFVWGAALGAPRMVFARATDDDDSGPGDSSITTHGRWQSGQFSPVFRQATAQAIADSIVYGLDASQKGARWDSVAVEATVFDPVFALGDVVTCKSKSHHGTRYEPFNAPSGNAGDTGDLEIDLPIRRMDIKFVSPTDAEIKLTLTREIDEPFDAFEFLFPKFPPFEPFEPGGGDRWPPEDGSDGCDCGITDSFNRVTAASDASDALGTSDGGWDWYSQGTSTTTWETDGDRAIVRVPNSGFVHQGVAFLDYLPLLSDVMVTAQVEPSIGSGTTRRVIVALSNFAGSTTFEANFRADGQLEFQDFTFSGTGFDSTTLGWGATTPTKIRINAFTDHADLYVWQATDPQPSTPTLSITGSYSTWELTEVYIAAQTNAAEAVTAYFNNLTVPNGTRCDYPQWDSFDNRLTSGDDLGVASSGFPWHLDSQQEFGTGGYATAFVHDGVGEFQALTGSGADPLAASNTQYNTDLFDPATDPVESSPFLADEWTMYCRFFFSGDQSPASGSFIWSVREEVAPGWSLDFVEFFWNYGGNAGVDASQLGVQIDFLNYVIDPDLPRDGISPIFLKWNFLNNYHSRVKFWTGELADEPVDWTAENTTGVGFLTRPRRVQLDIANNPQTIHGLAWLKIDWIDWNLESALHPCYPGGPSPTGVAAAGLIGMSLLELAGDAATDTFTVATYFVPGSVRVKVNGLMQRPGVDYTESPTTGEITFTSPPEASDVVEVEFDAGGVF